MHMELSLQLCIGNSVGFNETPTGMESYGKKEKEKSERRQKK